MSDNERFQHKPGGGGKIVAIYDYQDEGGSVLFEKVRYEPKSFQFRRRVDGKQYAYDLKGVRRVPFRLPKIKDAPSVVLCEGEKDCLNIGELGFASTTAPFGAANWPAELTPCFKDKQVFILYDVGQEAGARTAAASIHGTAKEVRICRLPLERREADVTDYLETIPAENPNRKAQQVTLIQTLLRDAELYQFQESDLKPASVEPVAAADKESLIIQKMSEVEAKPVAWLWHDRFPMGMLSLLVGDPGTGKSYLAVYIASRVSRGECFPDSPEPVPVMDTLYLSSEDSAEYTLKPRLVANGADCERIFRVSGVLTAKNELRYLDMEAHMPLIEKELDANPQIRLIIIDPIVGYLGKKVDASDTIGVRISLSLMASLAERRNIAIVGISHMNKNQATDALYRVAGSHQFVCVPRAVWLLSKDPTDESIPQRRLLSSFKMSIGFEASGICVSAEKVLELGVYRLCVDSEKIENLTAADVLNQGGREQTKERKKTTEAIKFLIAKLGSGAMVSTSFLSEEAERQDIKHHTLRIAKDEIGVLKKKVGFTKSSWMCYLPIPEDGEKK